MAIFCYIFYDGMFTLYRYFTFIYLTLVKKISSYTTTCPALPRVGHGEVARLSFTLRGEEEEYDPCSCPTPQVHPEA